MKLLFKILTLAGYLLLLYGIILLDNQLEQQKQDIERLQSQVTDLSADMVSRSQEIEALKNGTHYTIYLLADGSLQPVTTNVTVWVNTK